MILRDHIKLREGERLHAYPDPKSGGPPWTIGYGHTGKEVHPGLVWTQAQADAALDADIANATHEMLFHLPWSANLDQNRQSALIDMIFNMGIGKVLGFHDTLAALQAGNWKAAHDGMLNSQWYRDVGQRAVEDAEAVVAG
jgi:lysozyme